MGDLGPMPERALSIRGINREYGVGRGTVTKAIRAGELPACQLGPRRFIILRRDFESWLHKQAVRPSDFAAARVDEVLEREARSGAG
jgi:excisionase family DNA binding protein